jgi:malate dehydrogenase (oxaloacetate-decarboxylating)
VVTSEAKRVTDNMMIAAASALGNYQDVKGGRNDGGGEDEDDDDATTNVESPLLPPIERMRDVAIHIAIRVGIQAQKDGVAPRSSEQKIAEQVHKRFWIPEYRNYKSSGAKVLDQNTSEH